MGAGAKIDLIHVTVGASGHPANVFGDEGAEAANPADHGAGLNFHKLEVTAINDWRGGAEAKDTKGGSDAKA
jgi:hypothetical protein